MDTIINLIAGAIGGNILGKSSKSQNLGFTWNTIIGLLGGLASSTVLSSTIQSLISGALGGVVGGAVSGAIALFIINLIKKIFSSKK